MKINDTSAYHINQIATLKWEMTVPCMLEDAEGPCRKILKNSGTYGTLLYNFIEKNVNLNGVRKFIEAGGGYGWVARDFLTHNKNLSAVMVDISGSMLTRQKETLAGMKAEFVNSDFLSCESSFFKNSGLLILNEIIGDFPVIADMRPGKSLNIEGELKKIHDDAMSLIEKYSLDVPDTEINLNYGALKAVEKICSASVPAAFISEHSCEAEAPEELREIFNFSGNKFPEEIKLLGHSEYTIKFSYLEKIARAFGYRTMRGQYTDIIEIKYEGRVNFALRSNSSDEELEAIRLFVHDLYKYEYLILIKV